MKTKPRWQNKWIEILQLALGVHPQCHFTSR